MGHNSNAQKIQEAFIASLKETGTKVLTLADLSRNTKNPSIGRMFDAWSSVNREIIFAEGVGFVNYHVRSKAPGFWGITQSIENDFNVIVKELSISCWYVLLVGRDDKWIANGYIIDHSLKKPLIKPLSATNGQYKINEKVDLDGDAVIWGVQRVANKLVELGKGSWGIR